MKINIIRCILTITIAASPLILFSGCQTPGELVSTESSYVCPQCKTDTITAPIKGLTYKKHSCPSCKEITTEEDSYPISNQGSSGIKLKTVHICEACRSIVEPCSLCKAK